MIVSSILLYFVYNFFFPVPNTPQLDQSFQWGTKANSMPDATITKFRIKFTNDVIEDLLDRLASYNRYQNAPSMAENDWGVNKEVLSEIVHHWRHKYDFKRREIYLNKYEHFVTNIQGLDIHYVHVKPYDTTNVTVLPLLMLNSWPDTCFQLYDTISELTTPREGFDFVFEIVAPSLPGHGFSKAPTKPGLGAAETAVVLKSLMHRIGFDQYYLQAGNVYGDSLATLFPEDVLGYHATSPVFLYFYNPVLVTKALVGSFWPWLVADGGNEHRMYPLTEHFYKLLERTGYQHAEATKPDTLGIALSDSPVALAAYILDKHCQNTYASSCNMMQSYDKDILLDSIMIYWITNSATTAMRSHAENFSSRQMDMKLHSIPTPVPTRGVKLLNDYYLPDSFLKVKYTNYLGSTYIQDGGRLPPLESGDAFVEDLFIAVSEFIDLYHIIDDDVDE